VSEVNTVTTMLACLGFSTDAAGYLTRDAGISSLEEIAYLDVDEVEVHISRV
jgi:hypothetical protein